MVHEYSTNYLSAVQNALDSRLAKLPKKYSVSQLLDTWEISVRQACSVKGKKSNEFINDTDDKNKQNTKSTTATAVSSGAPTNPISTAVL